MRTQVCSRVTLWISLYWLGETIFHRIASKITIVGS
jgi:hypothetical protein